MWKWEAEGQPKAVIAIIHSAYEHHRWYAWLIEKLRTEGFHIVMGDLPGHGEQYKYSRFHNEEFDEYKQFTKQLLKVAEEYNLPIFLMGNGLGGLIGIHTLLRSKIEVAGAIFASPWLNLKKTPGKLSSALTSFSKLTSNVKLTHDISFKDFSRNYDTYKELQDEIPYNNVITVRWYHEIQQQMRILRDPELKLKNIPTLLMAGGQDGISDVQAAKQWFLNNAKHLSNFQYREWPPSYHSLFFEVEREEVYRTSVDFMDNVLRSLGYLIK